MRKFTMHFVGNDSVELFETCFMHPTIGEERRCVRGKRSGAYRGYATFQWTKAVQGLSLMMIEAAIRAQAPSPAPLLIGSTGTFASSLDYAIDKQTTWLYDMFGWDAKGSGFSRRLFIRSNPGQRLAAPVAITLNLNCLAFSEVEILLNFQVISDLDGLSALRDMVLAANTRSPTVAVEPVALSDESHAVNLGEVVSLPRLVACSNDVARII